MRKKSAQSASFNLRALIFFALFSGSVLMALFMFGASANDSGNAYPTRGSIQPPTREDHEYSQSSVCSLRVLLVYADSLPPDILTTRLLTDPDVTVVDQFDARFNTPTLSELQQYDVVYAFSNDPYADGVSLGNNLADYQDGGGVVVAGYASFFGPPLSIEGRWHSDGYSPYVYNQGLLSTVVTLGTHDPTHPLMLGVNMLNAVSRIPVGLSAGATEVAAYSDDSSAVAFQTNLGTTAVGMPAYMGDRNNNGSGQYARIIANAGRWLHCGLTTPTPTPTATAVTSTTPTATPTGTPNGCIINGSIDTGDPTHLNNLVRSGIPQTCPSSTTCGIRSAPNPHHYDEYTFTNTTGATQCVTVDTNTACAGVNFIFIAAYLGSFDPDNICTNWIGDSGSSPDPDQAFSFNVDDGQTFVVVVSELTPDAGCPAYTITVSPQAICSGPTPTATPTATATVTATPTATATVTATPTATPTVTATPTATATVTATPTATATVTATPTATATVTATPTATATVTATPTATATISATPTATATGTVSPTPTATARPIPTPRGLPTPRRRPTPPHHLDSAR